MPGVVGERDETQMLRPFTPFAGNPFNPSNPRLREG
jgi:hypothetical protein